MSVRSATPESLCSSDLILAVKADTLRLTDGDVLIALSPSDDDILLLHSWVLKQFPWFEAGLSGRWSSGKQEAVHPVTGQRTQVWTYGLVFHEEEKTNYSYMPTAAYSLQSGVAPSESLSPSAFMRAYPSWSPLDTTRVTAFQHTQYSTGLTRRGGDMRMMCKSDLCHDAVRNHKILFRLLYGLPAFSQPMPKVDEWLIGKVAMCLTDVVVYAELYGLLEHVAAGVVGALLGLPDIWDDVAREPAFYLSLAVKLRAEALFADAFRHLVGGSYGLSAHHSDLRCDAELELLIYKKREGLAGYARSLRAGLHRIAVSSRPDYNWKGKIYRWVPDVFLDSKRHKYTEDMHRYLARSIYGEWLHVKLSEGTRNDIDLYDVCREIMKHAKSRSLSLFGRNVAPKLTSIFHLGRDSNDQAVAKELEKYLWEILDKARELIGRHQLFIYDEEQARSDQVDYFTSVPVYEGDYPWHDEDPWERSNLCVEVEGASEDWLAAVYKGLGKDYHKAKEIARKDQSQIWED